ncbi:hypothetical protein T08_16307 [Trichinella sp. T8]|nr:hypothetical protein T08_16307 [Trichinella sp. T8]
MDGKQLLIPLWYNLESTIHAPGSHGCQQFNEHIQYVQHILLNGVDPISPLTPPTFSQ